MNYFKTTVMSICIMLIIVALPAKGGPPNRDLDVIATFLAGGVPFQANTVLHASHMGKCGEVAGASIPRKNNRGIQLAVFGCIFDSDDTPRISGFPLFVGDDVSSRNMVEMAMGLGRDKSGTVVSFRLFLLDEFSNAYDSGPVPFSGPMILQGATAPITVTINKCVTAGASNANGRGKGKKSKEPRTILEATICMTGIKLEDPP